MTISKEILNHQNHIRINSQSKLQALMVVEIQDITIKLLYTRAMPIFYTSDYNEEL